MTRRWYGAVGHRGSRGRGAGVEIGERRGGVRQVVPELVRGTGQAGLTSPAEWMQQGRSRGTVARIDLRLLHHPDCEAASADSGASARINLRLVPARPLRLHVSRPASFSLFTPPPLDRHRPLRIYYFFARKVISSGRFTLLKLRSASSREHARILGFDGLQHAGPRNDQQTTSTAQVRKPCVVDAVS